MNEMVKERLVLGAALKEAISNNQLKLVYQPQIFAETGELYGIEALARWHDPLHGHVPPSRFIPLAEEIGEIENIGRWVIAEACRQLAEWRSQNIHIRRFPLTCRHCTFAVINCLIRCLMQCKPGVLTATS